MNRFIIIFLASGLLFSCNDSYSIKEIDASKKYEWEVQSLEKYPSNLVIIVKGNIDDTCKINGIKLPSGNVNEKMILDSYTKKAWITYDPYKVKKGELIIKYIY